MSVNYQETQKTLYFCDKNVSLNLTRGENISILLSKSTIKTP